MTNMVSGSGTIVARVVAAGCCLRSPWTLIDRPKLKGRCELKANARPRGVYNMMRWAIPGILAVVSLSHVALAADPPAYDRKVDVVYGRKHGMALTLDVFTPKDNPRYSQHGPAIVWVVSGGWFSFHEGIQLPMIEEFLKRGYTVFAVVHGSQPRFTIPEITKDMNRAVRFIRYHAKDYQIDPDRIGVTGGSAGGHLSLMQGTAGDLGDKKAKRSGRPDVEPRPGRRLLLPADRFPQLRQAGRKRRRPRCARRFQAPVRFPGARPENQGFPADH